MTRPSATTTRCPFTVLIDTAEQQPFSFEGLKSDAARGFRPLVVQTEWVSLGRYPHSLGDYSVKGLVGHVHVERKSVSDCQGTILGFGDGRRERFECELANLSEVPAAAVVVEGTLQEVLKYDNPHGTKTAKTYAKLLLRSILAYQQDYDVPWMFCDSRRMAEVVTFRFLERFWRKREERHKEAQRLLAAI